MQRVIPNPPWADRLLLDNWPAILHFTKKHGLLVPEVSLTDKRQLTWREYGCGKYGCVYPTKNPGVVVKLTADENEAAVASPIMRWQTQDKSLEGIVRYYASLPISGKYKSENERHPTAVTLLWREEAMHAGGYMRFAKELRRSNSKLFAKMMGSGAILWSAVMSANRALNLHLQAADPKRLVLEAADHLDSARERLADAADPLMDGEPAMVDYEYDNGPADFAFSLAAFEFLTRELQRVGPLAQVGKTLLSLLKNYGVLLADVHDENVGMVTRGRRRLWVITDPGMAVFLGKKAGAVKPTRKAA